MIGNLLKQATIKRTHWNNRYSNALCVVVLMVIIAFAYVLYARINRWWMNIDPTPRMTTAQDVTFGMCESAAWESNGHGGIILTKDAVDCPLVHSQEPHPDKYPHIVINHRNLSNCTITYVYNWDGSKYGPRSLFCM